MQLLSLLKELSLHPKNAEELKGLILQLAVQGKLTAKWREIHLDVEPASVLLENFTVEKGLLIAEKKIKKEKPLPPLTKEDIPFELPTTWEWVKLINSIYLVTKGATPTSYGYQFQDEGINFIKIESVKGGEIKPHLIDCFISDEADANQKRSRLVEGDLLFSIAGTIGATAVVKAIDLPANTNQALAIIRGSQSVYIPIYLQVLLDSFVTLSTREKARGAAMNNISLGDLKEMLVPVPSKEEQKVIVEVVNALFKEVEQLEELTKERISLKEDFVTSALRRLTETDNTTQEWNYLQQHFSSFFTEKKNIKSLRETILQLAVQGKLTAQWRKTNPSVEHASILLDKVKEKKALLIEEKKIRNVKSVPIHNELRSIPDTWAWARMIDYLDVRDGTHDSPKYVSDGFPLVTSKNLYTKKLDITNVKYISKKDHDEISKRSKVDRNDILFAMIGTIGNPVIVDIEPNFSIKNVALIKYYEDGLCEPNYILNFLENATNEFKADSDGAVQSFVSLKKLRLKEIPIPPLKEQQAIVEKVNSLMALCDELEQQVDNSQSQIEQLMQSCLKEVFEA